MTKIGDRVRVRRRKDLLCEFVEPHDELGIIDIGHGFVESMYDYCGEETIIYDFEDALNGYVGYLLDIDYDYIFNLYMLETLDGRAL
jgi:hypothetical protein